MEAKDSWGPLYEPISEATKQAWQPIELSPDLVFRPSYDAAHDAWRPLVVFSDGVEVSSDNISDSGYESETS